MNRRNFVISVVLGGLTLKLSGFSDSQLLAADDIAEKTLKKFNEIIEKAVKHKWHKLQMGDLVSLIALQFENTPYVGGTLEGEGPEICRIDFTGLDCVTLFENSLCMARIIKSGKSKFKDLLSEVTFTRYRSGQLDGFISRLHYTADWIFDNIKKEVVHDLTANLGGIKFPINVGFMSQNPKYYKPLVENPKLSQKISEIENQINQRETLYIPKNNIKKIEKELKSGDIVAITTSKKGLDYSHTGLIIIEKGKALFYHASLKKKKVIKDTTISDYLAGIPSDTGATFLRPVAPKV